MNGWGLKAGAPFEYGLVKHIKDQNDRSKSGIYVLGMTTGPLFKFPNVYI